MIMMILCLSLIGCRRRGTLAASEKTSQDNVMTTENEKTTSSKESYTYRLDPGQGKCDIESIQLRYGNPYTLPTPTFTDNGILNYGFEGWYLGNTLIPQSGEKWIYSNKDGTLFAHYSSEYATVTYGLYPQTHVSDASLLSVLDTRTADERNGWLLYEGSYYFKKISSPLGTNYTFRDGTAIISGANDWFKCEPIEWKILSSDNGTYCLVSTVLLDAHRFNENYSGKNAEGYYANNDKNSEIRFWLNNDFYNTAFFLDSSYIQTTEVDNSAAVTPSSNDGTYVCENTYDKIYLLSEQDLRNTSYFPDFYLSSYCKPTDYAKANGARFYNEDASRCYYGNVSYWTRSPITGDGYATIKYYDGNGYPCDVDHSICVRPAMTIRISK